MFWVGFAALRYRTIPSTKSQNSLKTTLRPTIPRILILILRDLLRDARYGGLALWGGTGSNQYTADESRGSNVTSAVKRGNGIEYTMARLERDYPEYHEKVKSGELSANAAAILAGFCSDLFLALL
jgi:hypothetical protein